MDLLECAVCQRNSDFLGTVLGKSEHACRSLKRINGWDSSKTAVCLACSSMLEPDTVWLQKSNKN